MRRGAAPAGALLAGLLALAAAAPAFAQDLLVRLRTSAPAIDAKVLALALEATECAVAGGAAKRPARLAVIDYTRPSTERRLWLFNLDKGTLLKHEYVAHGRGSGGNVPKQFSNIEGSYQSSIGLFAAAGTYQGENGYSLRLDGLEPGINDRARERLLVMHGADYVDPVQGQRQGRLGRSWGCPALRPEATREIIDALKDGQLLFAYAQDAAWLEDSRFFGCDETER